MIVDTLLIPKAHRDPLRWFKYFLEDVKKQLQQRFPEIGPIQVVFYTDHAAFKFPRYSAQLYVVNWGRFSGWAEGESDPAEGWLSLFPQEVGEISPEMEAEGYFEIENREFEMTGTEGLIEWLENERRTKAIAQADQAAKDFMDR